MAAQFLKNRLLRLLLPEDGSLHLHLCVHLKLHLDVIFSLNTDENPVHYTYIRETQEFERQRLKNNYHVGDLCCDKIFCILIAVVVIQSLHVTILIWKLCLFPVVAETNNHKWGGLKQACSFPALEVRSPNSGSLGWNEGVDKASVTPKVQGENLSLSGGCQLSLA